MALTSGGTAPYAPPATVIDVITRYRDKGMLTPFTPDILERAGVPPTLSSRTLQALKLLEIVDSAGMPTEAFEAASRAPDDQYKERLGELILATYREVLAFADPATDNYERVRGAFRGFNPRGQQERMVTLFLGLLDFLGHDTAGATASRKRAEPGAAKKPNGSNGSQPATKKGTAPPKPKGGDSGGQGGSDQRHDVGGQAQGTDDLPPGLVGLLRQIPRGGAGWPEARRDEFMAAFKAVLNFSVPVREKEPAPSTQSETEVTAS